MKETKICKHCKEEINKKATVCPHCGRNQKSVFTRIISIIIGIFLVIIGISLIATIGTDSNKSKNSSSTDNSKNECYMTMDKFNEINNGMSYDDVKNIVGCDGTLSSEASSGDQSIKIYYWYAKNGISNANFSFQNDELVAKAQVGLDQ
mgnify:CR=1 FL=1